MSKDIWRAAEAMDELKHPVAEIEILEALESVEAVPEPEWLESRRLGIGRFALRPPALPELALDDDYLADEND